jgi:arylsulfatase A-like enzyme
MNTYKFCSYNFLGLAFLSQTIQAKEQINEKLPNIVFIMADDLGYGSLSCYGQKKFKTPNIDKLASEGTRFTQAYAGGSVSTASRCVLMTGLHNGHTAARDNVPHYKTYLHEKDITVAEMLKKAGYKTGGVGKWSLGDAGTIGEATNKGFDMWLGYLNQDHAHYYYPEYLDYNKKKLELQGNTLFRNNYSHQILTNGALNFIRSSADAPFFLYVAYTIPHYSAPEEDEDALTVSSIASYSTKRKWPESAKKYASMVQLLDQGVGQIVKLIDDMGLKENTLIVFTSDNGGDSAVWKGFKTNGNLRGYKRDLSEGGIRVPFIVRWSNKVSKGVSNNEIISFQDIFPTFADIAKSKTQYKTAGISILPIFLDENQEVKHPFLYWDYGHCRNRYDQAVRIGKWKGIKNGIGSKIQLFDLTNDIAEKKDIADKYPEIVAKIQELMKSEYIANEYYPLGNKYTGKPIWKKENYYDKQ